MRDKNVKKKIVRKNKVKHKLQLKVVIKYYKSLKW